jgi:hypothetical protein
MELLDGLPTIIGGYNADSQSENDVLYQYHAESREWIPHPNAKMRKARRNAAVFQVPKSLVSVC